jgi:hypothetical protein
MPSLAAKEKWEEERGKKEGMGELVKEHFRYLILSESSTNDFQAVD